MNQFSMKRFFSFFLLAGLMAPLLMSITACSSSSSSAAQKLHFGAVSDISPKVQSTPQTGSDVYRFGGANPDALKNARKFAAVESSVVPQTLGTLTLVSSVQGLDALREFSSLHNKEFALVGGYRADYASGKETATLWVAEANDDASALALTQDMAKKIGTGNAMFQNLQELVISGRQIYVVDGGGQQHYFYAHGNEVVWLATEPSLAAAALHTLWNVK
mgnify:CR=1 FL=1